MRILLCVEPLGRDWGVRRYRTYLPGGPYTTRKLAEEAAAKEAERLSKQGHQVEIRSTMKRPTRG